MKEREILGGLITKHNELAVSHIQLTKKHNKLCKSMKSLCFVCLGLDLLIFLNMREISKLKAELNKEKEKKEG